MKELAAALDAIFEHGRNVVPEGVEALRAPARPAELRRLARALGRPVPRELATWFSKHDGQGFLAPGIDPTKPALTWLSVSDAIRERAELIAHPEKMLPWDDRWLPILTNGGGDHYVYVTAGPQAGVILYYLYDARRRPRIAASLGALATQIARALADRDAPKLRATLGRLAAPLEDASAPSLAALARAPIGTVYYRRSLPYGSFWYRLFVKVTEDAWAEGAAKCKGVRDFDIARALANVRRKVRTSAVVDWKVAPATVHARLANAQVFPADVIAMKGRDPKKDPYFTRKKGQLR